MNTNNKLQLEEPPDEALDGESPVNPRLLALRKRMESEDE